MFSLQQIRKFSQTYHGNFQITWNDIRSILVPKREFKINTTTSVVEKICKFMRISDRKSKSSNSDDYVFVTSDIYT